MNASAWYGLLVGLTVLPWMYLGPRPAAPLAVGALLAPQLLVAAFLVVQGDLVTALLFAALVASPLLGLPADSTSRPAAEIDVIVLAPDLKPLPGVGVSLVGLPTPSRAVPPRPSVLRVIDDAGRVRLAVPSPGSYILRIAAPGVLATAVGPFEVCSRHEPCCPMLESPLRIVLPVATCATGSRVVP